MGPSAASHDMTMTLSARGASATTRQYGSDSGWVYAGVYHDDPIDPEHRSHRRESRRLPRGLPGPASDVDHPVRGGDSVRTSQHVVVVP